MTAPKNEPSSSSPDAWLAKSSASLGVDLTKAKFHIETEAEINARLVREEATHKTKQAKERAGFVISVLIVLVLLFFSL